MTIQPPPSGARLLTRLAQILAPLGLSGFFVMSGLFFLAGFAASGWVLVRLHRRHGITLAVPFAALVYAATHRARLA